MQQPTNSDDLLKPEAKVFITPQYKTFIKPVSYKNLNKKLNETTVKFLVEDYETVDVDHDKMFAENEFFHLRDTNELIKEKYEQIEKLSKHREMLKNVSMMNRESQIKKRLLENLKNSGKNYGQSDTDFTKKFEKILDKDGSSFISTLLKKIKKIEVGIGLEFPGSLQEEITRGHRELLLALTYDPKGVEVKVPEKVYHSFMLEDGFMINFMENINEYGYIEWFTKFYKLKANENTKEVSMVELKSDYEFRTQQRILEPKYYPEGNILVITSTLPKDDKNMMIQIFELVKNDDSVHFEPKHKIKTDGRWAEFVRAGGVEYLVYCNDLLPEEEFKKLNIMSFEETFVNPSVSPLIEKMNVDMKVFKTCNLDNGYIIGEGPKNQIALIDLSAKEVLAYYKDHKGEDYFNYLLASYSKTKNLLFVLHNSQNGAIISIFGVDGSTNTLVIKQNFELYTELKNASMQSFASRYFEFQFNHSENRLDIVDDYQRSLFRFKLNEDSKLVKDGEPISLQFETKDCTPSFLMTRMEGDLYFLQYFTFSSYLKSYYLKEE